MHHAGLQLQQGPDCVVCWVTRQQIAAIRRGMAGVVPERALKLCTWQALEMLVCGDPHIDVDILMSHTTYHGSGFNAGNSTVKRFWRVFRSMTDKERSKFIRFAWGRCVSCRAAAAPLQRQCVTHCACAGCADLGSPRQTTGIGLSS